MGDIQKQSRRGSLSPLIFNSYIQEAINTIRDRTQLEIKINGYRIHMLRYADDIAILVEN